MENCFSSMFIPSEFSPAWAGRKHIWWRLSQCSLEIYPGLFSGMPRKGVRNEQHEDGAQRVGGMTFMGWLESKGRIGSVAKVRRINWSAFLDWGEGGMPIVSGRWRSVLLGVFLHDQTATARKSLFTAPRRKQAGRRAVPGSEGVC